MFEGLSGTHLTLLGLAIYLLVSVSVAWFILRKNKGKSAWHLRREAERDRILKAQQRQNSGHSPS